MIFRDLLINNPTYRGRSSACAALLRQLSDPKEDDGARDLILETFRILWFNGKKEKHLNVEAIQSNASGVLGDVNIVTPTRCGAKRGRVSSLVSISETANQMVEVVHKAQCPSYLIGLVRRLLFDFEDKKSNKIKNQRERQKVMQKHCSNIVKCLVESLHNQEREDTPEYLRTAEVLSTLYVFAEASPEVLPSHIDTLLPFLKGERSTYKKFEEDIVLRVCQILVKISICLTKSQVKCLGDGSLITDLTYIARNFGKETTIVASIESLSKLSAIYGADEGNLFKKATLDLGKLFYTFLFKNKNAGVDLKELKSIERNHIHRSLTVLGTICRFDTTGGDLNALNNVDSFECVHPSQLSWENLQTSAFALFQTHMKTKDMTIKCHTLRAMRGIFSSRPRVMLQVEEEGLMKELMSEKSDPRLQLETLICWKDILESEEKRVDSGEAKRKIESKKGITLSEKISGDQDGDASLLGSCCIQHYSRLISMTLSTDRSICIHSLQLLQILLRQGLVSPMETVRFYNRYIIFVYSMHSLTFQRYKDSFFTCITGRHRMYPNQSISYRNFVRRSEKTS